MQPILYHARLLLDANVRAGPPNPATGELAPTIGPYLVADTIVQVIAETDHQPNPNAVWLQINYWQLQQDGETYIYKPGWVRQLKYVAAVGTTPAKYLPVTSRVLCPPEVFHNGEIATPVELTLEQLLKMIAKKIEG